MSEFADAALLLFVLLNPFLMSIYLLDLIQDLEGRTFRRVLVRGTLISFCVFSVFAVTGDRLFADVLHVRFAAFLLFGGIVLLIVGIRYILVGSTAIRDLRGNPEHIAGSIAMPFMIGPGTVSASVLIGSRLPALPAVGTIAVALTLTVVCVLGLKWLHDHVKQRHEKLIERYIDAAGRISALIIGTFAAEMILQGVDLWLDGGSPGG